MERVTLREYETLPLSATQAAAIARFEEDTGNSRRERVFEWVGPAKIKAKSHVGVIRMGDFEIEILPKTWQGDGHDRSNLLAMLVRAGKLPFVDVHLAAQEKIEETPLLDALAGLFSNALLKELTRGVDRSYVAVEEDARAVRGRILLSRQITHHHGLHDRVWVAYDDFSPDTALNRTLKGAARVLADSGFGRETRHGLDRVLHALDDVADMEPRRLLELQAQFHRGNERFRRLWLFARTILEGASPTLTGGACEAFSLLFPMERVFQEYVAAILSSHGGIQTQARLGSLLKSQDRSGNLLALKPDFVARDTASNDVLWVLDTKWKRLTEWGELKPSDGYQMHAYSAKGKEKPCILLYPGEKTETAAYRFPSGAPLTLATVNLMRNLWEDHDEVEADIRRIVDIGNQVK